MQMTRSARLFDPAAYATEAPGVGIGAKSVLRKKVKAPKAALGSDIL